MNERASGDGGSHAGRGDPAEGDDDDQGDDDDSRTAADAGTKNDGGQHQPDGSTHQPDGAVPPTTCASAPAPQACPNGTSAAYTDARPTFAWNLSVASPEIKYDAKGWWHAVFMGDPSSTSRDVYYATNRGGAVTLSPLGVTFGEMGSETSLTGLYAPHVAMDACGNPTVSYSLGYGSPHSSLYLATQGTNGWQHEQVPLVSETDVTHLKQYALSLDPQGQPVVYFAQTNGQWLSRMSRVGAEWHTDITTIRSESSDVLQLVHSSTLGDVLVYLSSDYKPAVAWQIGGAWVESKLSSWTRTISSGMPREPGIAAATTPDGTVQVAFLSYAYVDTVHRNFTLTSTSIAEPNAFTAPVDAPLPAGNDTGYTNLRVLGGSNVDVAYDMPAGSAKAYVSRLDAGVFAQPVPVPCVGSSFCNATSTLDATGRETAFVYDYDRHAGLLTRACAP